jgi:hypothetical protein
VVITKAQSAGGVVLFHPAYQAGYSLNGTGAEIWDYLKQGHPLREISLKLQQKPGTNPEAVNQELLQFTSMLWDFQLLRIRGARAERHPSLPIENSAGNRLAALKFLCHALSKHGDPETLAELCKHISSGRLPWQLVRNMANHYRVSSSLCVGLRTKELIHHLPEELRDYLIQSYEAVSRRDSRLRRQAIEIIAALNNAGIEPILLKGIAYLFSHTIEPLRAREMADIDLLVPPDNLSEAVEILITLGYRETQSTVTNYHEHHHWNPLVRGRKDVTVEIHSAPVLTTLSGILSTEQVWARCRPVEAEKFTAHVLCPTDRALLNILHSEIAHERHAFGQISLRDLHELTWMNETHGNELAWRDISATMERHGASKILRAYVHLASKLFGMPLSQEIGLNYRSAVHLFRCQATLMWPLLAKATSAVNSFSAEQMRRRFACDNTRWSVTTARARHLWHLVKRRIS